MGKLLVSVVVGLAFTVACAAVQSPIATGLPPTPAPATPEVTQPGPTPNPTYTPTPTSTPSPTPTPQPSATPTPMPTPDPTNTPTPTRIPTPTPVPYPFFTGITGTNHGDSLRLQAYFPDELEDNVVRQVILSFPEKGSFDYIVGFTKGGGVYHRGEILVEPANLGKRSLQWVQENVGIAVYEFPVRIACTGSMRPVMDCGDEVIFEPVRFGQKLDVGDIVTYRFGPDDVDTQRNCSSVDYTPSIVGTTYIIHRIIQVVRGASPTRYLIRGDNNSTHDACTVSERSIIFRVVDVKKDVYVADKPRYDWFVNDYQRLLVEYQAEVVQRDRSVEIYEAILADYNEVVVSKAPGWYELSLNLYSDLEDLVAKMEATDIKIVELWSEMQLAQREIELTIK